MKVNFDELEKYTESTNSEWFSLKNDGDVARVQFMYHSLNDLDTYVGHKIKVKAQDGKEYDRWVDCKRTYNDPIDNCPLCEAGLPQKPIMILKLYDHADGKIKIWERGKTFRNKLIGLFNRFPDLGNMVFEIERHGNRGDMKTTYDIYPMVDVEPVDIDQIEDFDLMGTVILDKTPDEMVAYIETGEFPPSENQPQQSSANEHIEREQPIVRRQPIARRGEAF